MKRRAWLLSAASAAALAACAGVRRAQGGPKVIIDSDYNTMSDDGQLGAMAVQLQAQGRLQVMGITVVSGNKWLQQGVAEALMSMERLGAGDRIGVYAGANLPLNHDYVTIQAELKAGAGGDGYLGAWKTPEPRSAADLVRPPDGFATRTQVQPTGAVDFIVQTIKAHPHEITLLAVGPLTNIALAIRQSPEIVPLIQQIIYMGGAVHVPGNTTKAAEFNWWFDPEAAQFVLRQPIPQVVVPLDVTNTVQLNKATFERIALASPPTAVTRVYAQEWFSRRFARDPNYTSNIWDTLVIAYLLDPSYATQVDEEYVDVIAKPGDPQNGRSVGYAQPPEGVKLQKMKVVKRFDNARFLDLYVDLLTRPVPVALPPAG